MNPPEERKPAARDSSEEVSLTRLATGATAMKNYFVKDGDFTSFPEIQATSAQQLIARGIKGLFPIQQHSFYPIYNREDVIARDLTGSGKTLAFCLPVTEYLRKNNLLGSRRIQAIILGPTRELAIQVSLQFSTNALSLIRRECSDEFALKGRRTRHFKILTKLCYLRFKMNYRSSSTTRTSSTHSQSTVESTSMTRQEHYAAVSTSLLELVAVFQTISKEEILTSHLSKLSFLTKLIRCLNKALKKRSTR